MNRAVSLRRLGLSGLSALFLSACAGYSSSALTPGVSTRPEVEARLGQPAMTWKNADGSQQLAFATGPGGTQTFMSRPTRRPPNAGTVIPVRLPPTPTAPGREAFC